MDTKIIWIAVAFFVAAIISFGATPVVKALAFKIGAVDVPKDERRMHQKPIARLGGLAMFLGFMFTTLIFCDLTKSVRSILLGSTVIVICGILDDIIELKSYQKLFFQSIAAIIAIYGGISIKILSTFNLFGIGTDFSLGIFEIPITFFWIIGMINAVNLIDGLDGLAVGISSIAAFSMLAITILLVDWPTAFLIAALAGACIGFMPYNLNPAKIFMGETGAAFLGYILATTSIQGLFKLYAVVSFAVPFLIMGLPLFDTIYAAVRRVLTGKAPWHADKQHIHHRMMDMGLSQKQAVGILYIVSAILGISAVVMVGNGAGRALIVLCSALVVAIIAANIYIRESEKNQQRKNTEKNTEENTEANTEENNDENKS